MYMYIHSICMCTCIYIYIDLLLLQLSPQEVRVTRHLCVCVRVCVCVCICCCFCVCVQPQMQTLASPAPTPYTPYHTSNTPHRKPKIAALSHPPHPGSCFVCVFFCLPHERACVQIRDSGLCFVFFVFFSYLTSALARSFEIQDLVCNLAPAQVLKSQLFTDFL